MKHRDSVFKGVGTRDLTGARRQGKRRDRLTAGDTVAQAVEAISSTRLIRMQEGHVSRSVVGGRDAEDGCDSEPARG